MTKRFIAVVRPAFAAVCALCAFMDANADSLDEMKQELWALRKQVETLEAKVALHEEEVRSRKGDSRPSTTTASAFNPALGVIIDTVAIARDHGAEELDFRSAELALSADVDPFVRGYAILNGTSDGVEVEEAALETTSLPASLKLRGGRFFADFGRLSKRHDHDLPFVNRPLALDRFIGGEPRVDGLELSYLVPIEQYLTLTAGAYDRLGSENDRNDELENANFRHFTYLGRAATFVELSDAASIDIGVSYAVTPRVEPVATSRSLGGVDLTFRYQPQDATSYQGFEWGSEWLIDSERAEDSDREEQSGLYTYGELKLSRRYRPGFLFDYAEPLRDDEQIVRTYSPYLTIWISEFQRLRFQYSLVDTNEGTESEFFAQWSAALGHHAHGFRDR